AVAGSGGRGLALYVAYLVASVDAADQALVRRCRVANDLLDRSGLLVVEHPSGVTSDRLQAFTHGVFGKFEDLTRTPDAACYLVRGQSLLMRVTDGPEVMEAIGEQRGRHVDLLLDSKRVNRLPMASFIAGPLADLLQQAKFVERAVERVFSLLATPWS